MIGKQGTASVGIVIRTRDRPLFVLRALRSVAAQTYRNWHILLVNDGGDKAQLEATLAKAELPSDLTKRLTCTHLDPGLGRAAAFNHAAQALSSDFIACLDDDDTWSPEFLSALTAFYHDTSSTVSELGGVLSRVTALREQIVETPEGPELRILGEDSLPASFRRPEFFVNALAYACYRQDLYPVQWVIRRDALLEVGGFPEEFDVMEDRAFMNRLLARYRMGVLDQPLAFHHRRVNRATDRTRDVSLNTLDNPSYDWRLYADLARPSFDLAQHAPEAQLVRSIMADLLAEVNYETSAIWQKVDGEMRSLTTRMDMDKAELHALISARPSEPATLAQQGKPVPAMPALDPINPENVVYDLWQVYQDAEHTQHLTPADRFADRLELSHHSRQDGLLLHVAPELRRLEVQIPHVRDWCAVELALDGLAPAGQGLRCNVQLWSKDGYLFESALTHFDPAPDDPQRYPMTDFAVHSCRAGLASMLTRNIDAGWLSRVQRPKLSIILPRFAHHFRFVCQNILIEKLPLV